MIALTDIIGRTVVCFLCGFPGGSVKINKRGKPYFTCVCCAVRVFTNTTNAVAGMLRAIEVIGPIARAAAARDAQQVLATPMEVGHGPAPAPAAPAVEQPAQ